MQNTSISQGSHLGLFAVGILTFLVYLFTLAPSVYLGDSGELTAAAFCLGVPHPSGYPVHTLLGKLFCMIPLGNVGFRVNLLSALLGALTVCLVYALILQILPSRIGAFVGACTLAFSRVFWWQNTASEVYALHAFFVVLMVWLLWHWDCKRDFSILMFFAFVTGLSFGNHMQTVMLAPAVFFLILSADRRALLHKKGFLLLAGFFAAPLLVYLLLPVRTLADAAVHWGDPDTWTRFWTHVSAGAHREGYVFNLSGVDYLNRLKESIKLIWDQFGVLVFLGLWGWWRIGSTSIRWGIFFGAVAVLDLFYTVFLNTIALEVTPFNLSTCLLLAVGMGVGAGEVARIWEARAPRMKRGVRVAFAAVPLIFLALNYRVSDQSENYTAHEHAVNILRTVERKSVVFLDEDNNVFPVAYARLVQRMREDATLFDRLSIFFKMRPADRPDKGRNAMRDQKSNGDERKILEKNLRKNIYYAKYGPHAVALPPSHRLYPAGILYKVVDKESGIRLESPAEAWTYYSTESFYGDFERDYMNREVCAYFFFNRGKALILSGQGPAGIQSLRLAREIGYNDRMIHSDMGVFLADHGLFEEARLSLERANRFHENLSLVYNNWGYLYHKMGDHENSLLFLQKAVELSPKDAGYRNNLGFALYKAGREKEARLALEKSLSLDPDQPEIKDLLKSILK